MAGQYEKISKNALKDVAEFMCVAARTAPKAKGVDNLEILIIEDGDAKEKLMAKMKEIGVKNERPSCVRDADNIKDAPYVVVLGTKIAPLGLNCGFCGYKTCQELERSGGVCVYNSLDLGIAMSSAVEVASKFHADNRIMYSIGKAAIEIGSFSKNVKIALGIPLSATGKNPFFDRK
ncbi:MAG: ferredoxin [Candidatus Omnitrophica bacterium CG07_land_8_20_14_0_80_42_15]|uniref:Ferredoxin n=1 Tax=Candidatus Aquitaenariimonas noxiae TaxID=1974741 RepID=A0A2J0L1K6_9BACT|nr:MAG: ferredoxin [Candidatus Omnitrophica bacterium CG07_land_8_20_14_0_80_42_15]